MLDNNISIKEYLQGKDITFKEHYGELVTACLFNGCDDDSESNEAHLYFNAETSQYECKKCGEKGNLLTLAKFLKDETITKPQTEIKPKAVRNKKFDADEVERCHAQIPVGIRQYLNNRGINDSIINQYKIGYGKFYNANYITIPITDENGNYIYFKLRQDPQDGDQKITYPNGLAQLYDWETLKNESDQIVVCEGELDRLVLMSRGIPAVTSTHGANTFKNDWVGRFAKFKRVYICMDLDKTGRESTDKIIRLMEILSKTEIYRINLPEELGEKGDVTDYFTKFNGTADDFFGKYCEPVKAKIDVKKFKPMSLEDLVGILELSIKKDDNNKLIAFLCMLSAYTEESQFNISFNAPSSTGKSFIPLELVQLFPVVDRMELGYCSPSVFFHDNTSIDSEGNNIVDLSRKIIIFLDQPNNELLARLRPLLSHDSKIIIAKITDKNQKSGLRVKEIHIIGYPSVIFCTAGLTLDEQESTRFFVLSPETSSIKVGLGIDQVVRKAIDPEAYRQWLDSDPDRKMLKERILAIRTENINDIKITPDVENDIKDKFRTNIKEFQPRHQRDIKKFISLIKANALLNLWWREQQGETIVANADDVASAFKIWSQISQSQESGIPPYVLNILNEVILPAWREKFGDITVEDAVASGLYGLTRQQIAKKHLAVYGRLINENVLRTQILPTLQTSGLIDQQKNNLDDRRVSYVYPCNLPQPASTIPADSIIVVEENNSAEGSEMDAEKFAKSSAYSDGLDYVDDGKSAIDSLPF